MPSANTTTTPLHSSTLCSQHHHTHTHPGGGEGAIDSGEGEAVHGDETGAAEAARARSCWATADLPAVPQGEDQTDEGMDGKGKEV